MKKKLNTSGIQLVSVTHDFKFQAPDGKQRFADALDSDCVQTLAENYPNNRARSFLHWFTYSDNSIDGQSKKKAYTLIESGLLDSMNPGTVECLKQIHAYLFGGLYDCIEKDLNAMQYDLFDAPIVRFDKNGKHCIAYDNYSFSIFKHEMSREERNLLHEVLSTLGQFNGLDNFKWLDDFKIGLGLEERRPIHTGI